MLRISAKTNPVTNFFKRLERALNRRGGKMVGEASDRLALWYRTNMYRGLDANHRQMQPVTNATMEMPIRVSSDRRKRKTVNNNKNKPIQATGATIRGIKSSTRGKTSTITSSTSKGDMIMNNNAKGKHGRKIGKKGGVQRTRKRDPLTVTNKAMDVFEKEFMKELDKLIGKIL